MMKYILLIMLIVIASCVASTNETNGLQVKVGDIKIISQTDSLSYALGVVWAKDIINSEIKGVSYSFYLGTQAFLKKDTSIMGIGRANNYLEIHHEAIKRCVWPMNDNRVKLSDIKLTTLQDSFSYALGYAWSRNVYRMGITEISAPILPGICSALKNDSSVFTYTSANKYLTSYIIKLRDGEFEGIKKMNSNWLEANRNKEGVIALASGLQYKVLKSGSGKNGQIDDGFECNYKAQLIQGTIFEDTYKTGKIEKFYLSGVCKGMGEALLLMKQGDIWEIYLPYQLAFGSGGIANLVPPFSTVIYTLEFVGSHKVQAAQSK